MSACPRISKDLARCLTTQTTYPPEAWIESYEMAMELLEVNDAACAKYFTMMLDETTRTWLKGLPANSIGSWAELKDRFIQNFKDT